MRAEIEDLHIAFPSAAGLVEAVRGVNVTIGSEKLALVGESGSGKSLTARALLRLLPPSAHVTAAKLTLDGINIPTASNRMMREIRGKRAGLILQDPKYALNPVMTAGAQIAEAWRTHKGGSRHQARAAAIHLLDQVRIRNPTKVAEAYPHQLSGGMAQRVMIAMTLAPDPELLIADEPTNALDATIQAEILTLIQDVVTRRNMSLLLITHDLPTVANFCDRVVVMYAGKVVETLMAKQLVHASHPYTRGLLDCVPSLARPKTRLPILRRDPAWSDR